MIKEYTIVPYVETEGYSDVVYCQIDHCEITGIRNLMNHANKLIIKTFRANKSKYSVEQIKEAWANCESQRAGERKHVDILIEELEGLHGKV